MNFKELVLKYTGYEINDYQINQFEIYYEFLIEYNQKVNLTRITEKEDVYIKHFLDSILPIKQVDFTKLNKIIDMGSGAGFPGIPLKILYPHLEVLLVDARKKKLIFLDQLIEKLNLSKTKTLHERLEKIQTKDYFDLATARALSSLEDIIKYAYPLIKKNGYILSYKSVKYEEELNEVSNKYKDKTKVVSIENTYLPEDSGTRNNILIKKI
ncbi:MAG TPA: 16S rRNA (guanine(527)-N(7))-methyltransferase RsmG [Acholeplasmataceae bacterium]|jgi:16S rRNA (guanine527-N7)-methyltransferase|nr:16S rRNA (guanine(527)-N(7))-methyltransferase RsmG [Acholeplasmataceae bacterium]